MGWGCHSPSSGCWGSWESCSISAAPHITQLCPASASQSGFIHPSNVSNQEVLAKCKVSLIHTINTTSPLGLVGFSMSPPAGKGCHGCRRCWAPLTHRGTSPGRASGAGWIWQRGHRGGTEGGNQPPGPGLVALMDEKESFQEHGFFPAASLQ